MISAWNEGEWTLVEPLGPLWTNLLLRVKTKVNGVPRGHWCRKCVKRQRGDGCECELWAQILVVLLTKDVVLLNHSVPQFPQLQDEDNHNIYCIRAVVRIKQVNASKLWVSCLGRSERSARVSCSYEPGAASKSQGPSVAGRQEKEGELPFPTNSMHLCIVHISYCMHPLSKFFLEANRVPC